MVSSLTAHLQREVSRGRDEQASRSKGIIEYKEESQFDGTDITNFLRDFEDRALQKRITSDEELCSNFVMAVKQWRRDRIKVMEGFKSKQWKKLKAELLKKFRDRDTSRDKISSAYLEGLAAKSFHGEIGLSDYTEQVEEIWFQVSQAGTMLGHQVVSLYLAGLPKDIRREVQREANIDPEDVETYSDPTKITSIAEKIIRERSDVDKFSLPEIRKKKIDKVLERTLQGSQASAVKEKEKESSHSQDELDPELLEMFSQLKLNKVSMTDGKQSFRDSADPVFKKARGNGVQFALAIKWLDENLARGRSEFASSRTEVRKAGTYQNTVPSSSGTTAQFRGACFSCGGEHVWFNCPEIKPLMDEGTVHFDPELRRMRWGKLGEGGDRVFLQPDLQSYGHWTTQIQKQLTERQRNAAVRVQTLSNPDSDAEESYPLGVNDTEFIGDFFVPSLADKQTNCVPVNAKTAPSPPKREGKGAGQQVQKGRVEKNNTPMKIIQRTQTSRAAVASEREGTYGKSAEPMDVDEEVDMPGPIPRPIVTEGPGQDIEKRLGTRPDKLTTRQYDEIVNQTSPDMVSVIGQIENSPITVSFGQLRRICPEVRSTYSGGRIPDEVLNSIPTELLEQTNRDEKRQQRLRKNRAYAKNAVNEMRLFETEDGNLADSEIEGSGLRVNVQTLSKGYSSGMRIQTLDWGRVTTDEVVKIEKELDRQLYRSPSPTVGIQLGINETDTKSLMDTGAEINTMSNRIAQEAGIVVNEYRTEMFMQRLHYITLANGSRQRVKGWAMASVKLAGTPFVYKDVFFFVADTSDWSWPVILGMPFARQACLNIECQADGAVQCSVLSQDGTQGAQWQACNPNVPEAAIAKLGRQKGKEETDY
jgi:hypothetical protein